MSRKIRVRIGDLVETKVKLYYNFASTTNTKQLINKSSVDFNNHLFLLTIEKGSLMLFLGTDNLSIANIANKSKYKLFLYNGYLFRASSAIVNKQHFCLIQKAKTML